MRVIDAATDVMVGGAVLPERKHQLRSEPATTPDSHVIVLGQDHVFDLAPDGAVTQLPTPDASALAVSPDGKYIYLGQTDGTVARIDRARAAAVAKPVAAQRPQDITTPCPGERKHGGVFVEGANHASRGKLPDDAPDPDN